MRTNRKKTTSMLTHVENSNLPLNNDISESPMFTLSGKKMKDPDPNEQKFDFYNISGSK